MSEAELAELERLGTKVLADLGDVTLVRLQPEDVARFGELLAACVQTMRAVRSSAFPRSEDPTSHG